MTYLFQQILYRPFLNLLVFFYQTIAFHDFGFAIILSTLLVRLILFPFFHQGAKQQMLMQRIQPKVKKIQETHKDDREKQATALMELYKEHGINPFSSILLLLIQIPIMIAFYWVVRSNMSPSAIAPSLYPFIPLPPSINTLFLGVINLANPNIVLIALAAIAQFFQARLALYRNTSGGTPSQAEKIAQQMSFVGPIVTLLVFYGLPASVGLYWLVSSAFSAIQQIFVNKNLEKKFGK